MVELLAASAAQSGRSVADCETAITDAREKTSRNTAPEEYDRGGAVGQAIKYIAEHAAHRDGPTLRRWRAGSLESPPSRWARTPGTAR